MSAAFLAINAKELSNTTSDFAEKTRTPQPFLREPCETSACSAVISSRCRISSVGFFGRVSARNKIQTMVPPEVNGRGRFLLRRRDFIPAYLRTYEEGWLKEKVAEALSHLGPSCRVCPRLCKGVDRLANQFGVCRVGRKARVAFHISEKKMSCAAGEVPEPSSSHGAIFVACSVRISRRARWGKARNWMLANSLG